MLPRFWICVSLNFAKFEVNFAKHKIKNCTKLRITVTTPSFIDTLTEGCRACPALIISTSLHVSKHRISIQPEGKRGGGGSSSFELNLTDPCRTWGMLGRRAGSTVSVYAQVQCREPKTGQQKVQLYCEDEIHWRSGYSLSMCQVVNISANTQLSR